MRARYETPATVATFASLFVALACGGVDDRAPEVLPGEGMLTPAPGSAEEPSGLATPTGDGTTPSSEGVQGEIPLAGGPANMGTTPAMTPSAMTPSAMTPDTPAEIPAATGYPENTGAECPVSAAELSRNENLPDPFAMNDGTRISTKAQWTCRRNEIKKDIERYEVGTKPEPPTVNASLAGAQLNVAVTTGAGSITRNRSRGELRGEVPRAKRAA